MAKLNYSAWEIDLDDFYLVNDKGCRLKYLINFAVLAPSSHNTQPWKFLIEGSDILILPDYRRSLKVSDNNNRQLFISLGCALKNLLIASDYYGYHANYSIEKSLDGINFFIRIRLDGIEKTFLPKKEHILPFILKRTTKRLKHTQDSFDHTFIKEINYAYEEKGIKIDLIEEKKDILKIADLVIKSGIDAMKSRLFRKELSHYVKNNNTNSEIGMPCFGMGISTIPSYFASTAIKFFNMNKLSQISDKRLLKNFTKKMLIISSDEDSVYSWVNTGLVYQDISLNCLIRGISTSPMAGVIQIGNHYKEIQRILNIKFRPQFFCRLGIIKEEVRHSPRIPSQKLIKTIC